MIQKSTYHGILIGASIVLLFLLFVASNTLQNNQSLERRVTALENRVTQLERGSQQSQHPTTPQSTNPWRSLQNGMTMDQVRGLLGEPTRVLNFGIAGTNWNYDSGMVSFGRDNRVDGWREP
jgi:outer membrane protein assembly factor BamE (lipoprotein component of BamABCDE complex)